MFLGVLLLSLCGYSLFTLGKKKIVVRAVNEHHPFTVSYQINGAIIFVNTHFQNLHINELSYEWDGNTLFILKDQHYSCYYQGCGHEKKYSLGHFTQINPRKWFRYKKFGDTFKFTLKVRYSFDNEPENTQISEFEVNVDKEKKVTFLGWSLMEWVILFFFGATI